MYYQLTINGLTLIPVHGGKALVRSEHNSECWHAVSLTQCGCFDFAMSRGSCAHVKALASYLNVPPDDRTDGVDDGWTETFAEWQERRAARREQA